VTPEELQAVVEQAVSAALTASGHQAHARGAFADNSIAVPGGLSRRRKAMMIIDGPRPHGRRFRLRIREAGIQRYESFETEAEAMARKRRLDKQAAVVNGVTVEEALEEYARHQSKTNMARSVEVTQQRLRALFGEVLGNPVALVKKDALVRAIEYDGAPSTRRGRVNQGRTFLAWCASQGWARENVLADVVVAVPKQVVKPTLTADEAARFLDTCLRLADDAVQGRRTVKRVHYTSMSQLEGTVAAATALWVGGRRASEVTDRQVRDLDRKGTVLNLPDAKTASGIGSYRIHPRLQPYLAALAEAKAPTDPLFGPSADRHDLARWVRRICRLAGVPVVGPHALRRTHGTLERVRGTMLETVADSLGHAGTAITLRHYVSREADAIARQGAFDTAIGAK
jgi:integrase